ncbi:GNAT family N-acetyltransferase [Paenibacillus sepulcri]
MYRKIEELTLNGWPALQTLVMDGWLLRTADGYTKRSNSVSPIYSCDGDSLAAAWKRIRDVEHFYTSAGLDVIFKITPFAQPDILDSLLEQDGYEKVEPSSVMLLDLEKLPKPGSLPALADIRIEETVTDRWLQTLAHVSSLSAAALQTARSLIEGSKLRQGFLALSVQGRPAACGFTVVERGYMGLYDIAVHPDYRNRGIGKELVARLLQWGGAQGAAACYLQVVQSNAPANRLYDKFGFEDIYTYWYRVKRRAPADSGGD